MTLGELAGWNVTALRITLLASARSVDEVQGDDNDDDDDA